MTLKSEDVFSDGRIGKGEKEESAGKDAEGRWDFMV